jgi:hypothetical protein
MLIQKLWQVAWDQWDNRNEFLHKSKNCVYLSEAQKITSHMQAELATVIQGTLRRDKQTRYRLVMATA